MSVHGKLTRAGVLREPERDCLQGSIVHYRDRYWRKIGYRHGNGLIFMWPHKSSLGLPLNLDHKFATK